MQAMNAWQPVPLGLFRSTPADELAWVAVPRVVPRRVAGRLRSTRLAQARIANRLRRDSVDIVHAHFGTGAVTVLPAVKKRSLPLVVTFHGFDASRLLFGNDIAARRYQSDLRGVFDYASVIIAVSEYIADNVRSAGAPPAKIRVMPIGSKVVPPVSGARAEERAGILFVGRLVPKKGVDDLLDSIALIDAPLRATPVTIVGDGPERSDLERKALDLGLNVSFTGALDHEGVRRKMSEASIFVAPSKTAPDGDAEGFGMVFLEASQAGLASIAYRHGGVREAVVDGVTGLLADEGDVAQLSRKVAELLKNPERARSLGEAGRLRATNEFDIRTRTAALEGLYDEVLRDHRDRS